MTSHYNYRSDLLEAVPNISEGRDSAKVDHIVAAAVAKGGTLLHVESGATANRSVITLAGPPEILCQALLALVETAISLIDLRTHQGSHPRIGAVDVIPLIPLGATPTATAVALADKLGTIMGSQCGLPIYLYEQSARTAQHQSLAALRKGGLVQLSERMAKGELVPDYGPFTLHPTAGATVLGARPFLIAYNISLGTRDVHCAQKIAAAVRSKSDGSGLRGVRALGWWVEEYQCCQVSCNLLDYRLTGMKDVFDTVRYLAQQELVSVVGSELVGMVPLPAIQAVTAALLEESLEVRQETKAAVDLDLVKSVHAATEYLGLSYHYPFVLAERIIEAALSRCF